MAFRAHQAAESPACRGHQHRETGAKKQAVENMLERAEAHSQDDGLPDECTGHDGRSDDQSLEDGVVGQRPKLSEGGHLADHQCERTRRLGGQKGPLKQTIRCKCWDTNLTVS
jgi:hypothetical protein